MYSTETPTPIQSRLRAIQEKRDAPHPSKFAIVPKGMSPFVRAAREKSLRPAVLCGGSFVPSGDKDAA